MSIFSKIFIVIIMVINSMLVLTGKITVGDYCILFALILILAEISGMNDKTKGEK